MREVDGDQAGSDEVLPRMFSEQKEVMPARRRFDKLRPAETAPLLKRIAEFETLQVNWKSDQQKLEVRNLALTSEASRITARLALLEEELVAASTHAGTFQGVLSKERNRWRAAA